MQDDPDYVSVEVDNEFLSSEPAMQRLGVYVYSIVLSFESGKAAPPASGAELP